MTMAMQVCFETLVARWTDQAVVISAGDASEMWWRLTGETERVFYLEASVWAFSGDGAFLMNPGMLTVERRMALPNPTHFLVANGVYGAIGELGMADGGQTDYAGLARAAGLRNVHRFAAVDDLKSGLDEAMCSNDGSFVVLDIEPAGEILPAPPMDGPESKFRFGRYLERTYGVSIFDNRPG